MSLSLQISVFLLVLVSFTTADHGKSYKETETVTVLVNKIGPYANPSETYRYYSLPFCAPPTKEREAERKFSLGELLEGDQFRKSLYDISFKQHQENVELCSKELTPDDLRQFKQAIDQFYYFEISIDDLPAHGFVGSNKDGDYYLFKHIQFNIEYNGNRIISVGATSDPHRVAKLENEVTLEQSGGVQTVDFTYSVVWTVTEAPLESRGLTKSEFFNSEMEIHWLSVMNSFVLAILLSGFLVIILLRVLKSDYTRYNTVAGDETEEDYGWKLVHGDVFRFPPHKILLCSLLGNGAQFLCICIGIIFLALIGTFYPGSYGSGYTAACILYALTSVVAGFLASNTYAQMGAGNWAWNLVATASIYSIPFLMIFAFVNATAKFYGCTSAVSFIAIVIVLCIWLFVGFPLTVIGGIAGRRAGFTFDAPVRTKNFPREIPSSPWYRKAPVQMAMAGFLPFRNSYTLYGILLLVFIILLVVTACITVALTYFQLSMEDYRWWWHSFACGGSTGVFVYIYSIFYYFFKSNMFGFLQASFYFGYMLMICYLFFVMLGTVGFFSSLAFIRRIYTAVHVD